MLTAVLVLSCAVLFGASLWSAVVLAGRRSALGCAGLALALGWFAEQMGSSRGWFFGRYRYTDVLGPELGNVPVVIALMWFALCWLGYVMANLMLWRKPVLSAPTAWAPRLATAWLAALVVTIFDLGADPYFVYVLRAWIMGRTDGDWFGETVQGFAGWMTVSFVIVLAFQTLFPPAAPGTSPRAPVAALLPIATYSAGLLFQMAFGHPVETRTVAFFAMGLPTFVALVAWWQWRQPTAGAPA